MFVDTNILIYLFSNNPDQKIIDFIVSLPDKPKPKISQIVYAEYLSHSDLTDNQIEIITKVIKTKFTVVPTSEKIILHAAKLRRQYKSLKLPDAIIASLAMMNNKPLATRNVSDFKKIAGLKLVEL